MLSIEIATVLVILKEHIIITVTDYVMNNTRLSVEVTKSKYNKIGRGISDHF